MGHALSTQLTAPAAAAISHASVPTAAPRCSSDRLLAFEARFGLSNRLLELQTALRIAQLSNRTLLLPALLPGIEWDEAFDTTGLMTKHCVAREGKVAPRAAHRAVAVRLPDDRRKMKSYLGLPVTVATLAAPRDGEGGLDTRGVAAQLAHAHADEPLVVLLSTLHVLREPSAACASRHVRQHCTRPGVGFWAPPPPFVRRFWRSLLLPSAAVARHARRVTRALRALPRDAAAGTGAADTDAGGVATREGGVDGYLGVHMRNADGSCPTRVAMWYGGMRMVPPQPRCGKVPGCTSLDTTCCDFTLVRDTKGDANRFPPSVLREVRGYCEEELADARLLSRLAAQGGLRRVYVGADGQRPDLERQLDAALRARGLRVLNESRPPPPRVWSSQYTRTGWRLTDVEGALADMYVLAEAEVFLANPASSLTLTPSLTLTLALIPTLTLTRSSSPTRPPPSRAACATYAPRAAGSSPRRRSASRRMMHARGGQAWPPCAAASRQAACRRGRLLDEKSL